MPGSGACWNRPLLDRRWPSEGFRAGSAVNTPPAADSRNAMPRLDPSAALRRRFLTSWSSHVAEEPWGLRASRPASIVVFVFKDGAGFMDECASVCVLVCLFLRPFVRLHSCKSARVRVCVSVFMSLSVFVSEYVCVFVAFALRCDLTVWCCLVLYVSGCDQRVWLEMLT